MAKGRCEGEPGGGSSGWRPRAASAAWVLLALLGCGNDTSAELQPPPLAAAGSAQAGKGGSAGQGGAGQGGAGVAGGSQAGAGGSAQAGSGVQACVPGKQEACACLGGVQGIQVCADDGSRFGPCLGCGGSSAGSGGQGGLGGASGQGGSPAAGAGGWAAGGAGSQGGSAQAGSGASGSGGAQAGQGGSVAGAGHAGSAGEAGKGGAGSAGKGGSNPGGSGGSSGSGGNGGQGNNCGLSLPEQICGPCVAANCCQQFQACFADTACSALMQCLGKCNNDINCDNICLAQHADGFPVYNKISQCMQGYCQKECASPCGNGVKDFGEACDGVDLGDATCASLGGLPSGILSCRSDCTLDVSGCTPGENTAALCSDGKDNDGDKYVDCDDKDCCSVVDCKASAPTSYCGKNGGTGGSGPASDCCQVSPGFGCSGLSYEQQSAGQRAVEVCVCSLDPSCCKGGRWDGHCVEEVSTFGCGAPCVVDPAKAENMLAQCSDGQDNDGDGTIDCDDRACCKHIDCSAAPQSFCGQQQAYTAEDSLPRCADGADNDFDKFTDCDDKQCCGFKSCDPSTYCGKLLASEVACKGVFAPAAGCRACLDASCCAQSEACANDAGCKAYFGCIAPCGTEPGCVAACGQPPALYGPLESCGMASCKGPCADDPAGPWGSDGPSCRGLTFDTNALQSCTDAGCCALSELCTSSPQCAGFYPCMIGCEAEHPGDPTCRDYCGSKFPNASFLYDSLRLCQQSHGCVQAPPATEASDPACSDGADNDGDGKVDCDDPGCTLSPDVSVCPHGVSGSCCTPHATPGCDQVGIQSCLCDHDLFCCQVAWDASCVEQMSTFCGACSVANAGEPDFTLQFGLSASDPLRLVLTEDSTSTPLINLTIGSFPQDALWLAFPDLLKKNTAYTLAYFLDQFRNDACDPPPTEPGWSNPLQSNQGDLSVQVFPLLNEPSDTCAQVSKAPAGQDLTVEGKGFSSTNGHPVRFTLMDETAGAVVTRILTQGFVQGSFAFAWRGALQPGHTYAFSFSADTDGDFYCHYPLDLAWKRTFVAASKPVSLSFTPDADQGDACPP